MEEKWEGGSEGAKRLMSGDTMVSFPSNLPKQGRPRRDERDTSSNFYVITDGKKKQNYDTNYKIVWKQRVDDLVEHLGCVMDKDMRKQLKTNLGAKPNNQSVLSEERKGKAYQAVEEAMTTYGNRSIRPLPEEVFIPS